MKLHNISFFCDIKKEPTCNIDIDESDHTWPVTIKIDNISIYLSSIRDLIKFKNSFLSSFEKAMREMMEVKDE